ncbi:hypothetical protein I4F81_012125 [Pyropia yezoensis]|uniref:Uncharacterized protein n=1 Tax=Pyropia yezoensis TaxID=2788 RepID=A0ACC3CHH6_PYRYE|nr:hypothetical protein I4F81_012125 [Neopyropia yezoensis]
MGRRSKALSTGGSGPSHVAAAPRDYGLPDDDDMQGWRALQLPFAGRLRLVANPSRRDKMVGPFKRILPWSAARKPLVDVWLQCGLYWREAVDGEEAPVPGDPLPTTGGAQRGWSFCPLVRDTTDGTRSFDVHVKCVDSGTSAVGGAGWRVTVRSPVSPPAFDSVVFEAATRNVADEWERQMVIRAVPLTVVWERVLGDGGGGGGSAASPSARPRVGGVWALADAVGGRLKESNIFIPAVGVVTALLNDDVFNAVTSGGACVAFVAGTLLTGVRVCASIAAMGGVAEDLRQEVRRLLETMRSTLLPGIGCLRELESANAEPLLKEMGALAGSLDALTGKLMHLSLSLGGRVRQAVPAHGRDADLKVGKQVSACKLAVRELRDSLGSNVGIATLHHLLTTARDEQAQALADARSLVALPRMSDPTIATWSEADAHQPWARLWQVVVREPTPSSTGTCAIVASTHGMGGIGKTTVSMLVAARVADDGKLYPEGVYWVRLGRKADSARAIECMLAVATCVLEEKVTAPSIERAADRLREALADKSVLVVVDDCWSDELARHCVSAVRDPRCGRCCLLFTTRSGIVARRASSECLVRVQQWQRQDAKKLLLAYARRDGSLQGTRNEVEERALAELVEAAAGLPLALALLGSLVCAKGWAAAAEGYRDALRRESSSADGLPWAAFRASYDQLCDEDPNDGVSLNASLYRKLCVIRKQDWLPLSALAALWDMEEKDAELHFRDIANLSLVTVRQRDGTDTMVVGLHDLVVDWVHARLVPILEERQGHHKKLVDGRKWRSWQGTALRCTAAA